MNTADCNMIDSKLRRRERVQHRTEFGKVFARKACAANKFLVLHVAPNQREWSRLGISTSRRLGNAVCRNRLRRRVREAFRQSKSELPTGLDMVCVVRSAGSVADMKRSLLALVTKAARRLER